MLKPVSGSIESVEPFITVNKQVFYSSCCFKKIISPEFISPTDYKENWLRLLAIMRSRYHIFLNDAGLPVSF